MVWHLETRLKTNMFPVFISGQCSNEAVSSVLWAWAGKAAGRSSTAARGPARQEGSSSHGCRGCPHKAPAGWQASCAFFPPPGGIQMPTSLVLCWVGLQRPGRERDDSVNLLCGENRKQLCVQKVLEQGLDNGIKYALYGQKYKDTPVHLLLCTFGLELGALVSSYGTV